MTLRSFALILVLAGGMPFSGDHAQAQNPQNPDILFQAVDEGDLTFFYDSAFNSGASEWVAAFRDKGGFPANQGLTAPFNGSSNPATWDGIVGAAANDYLFSKLTTEVKTRHQHTVGSTAFYLSPAKGSSLYEGPPAGPDFGIRTRLRENQVAMGTGTGTAVNQFDSFTLTLVTGSSTFNGGPLTPHVFLSGTSGTPLINTDAGLLTASFSNVYGHQHYNWGFSQYGDYDLVFEFNGVGGLYGGSAPTGSLNLGFVAAVPEPGTLTLAGLGMAGTIAGFRWLRRRRRPEAITEDSSDEA
jgi:hypothetical protein